MKENRKIIQLVLISFGFFLILTTYFVYPFISGEKNLESSIKDKSPINKRDKDPIQNNLGKNEETLDWIKSSARKELNYLAASKKPKIEERIVSAKINEDFETNKDYIEAKKELSEINNRITELNEFIDKANNNEESNKLEKELNYLITSKKPVIEEAIESYKIDTNKNYVEAKKELSEINNRITELNEFIDKANNNEESNKLEKDINTFVNVEYTGLFDFNNNFTIRSEQAFLLKEDSQIVYMTNMYVILHLNDGRSVTITSERGRYNKENSDCFFETNVKATDGETVILSDNLDLVTSSETASVYNNVVVNSNKGSLIADKVDYNFETKYYHVSMYNKEKVKIKIIK